MIVQRFLKNYLPIDTEFQIRFEFSIVRSRAKHGETMLLLVNSDSQLIKNVSNIFLSTK